jgi:hypothetical protein
VIVAFTGQPARNIQQWATIGRVPKSEKSKGYPFLETVTAVRQIIQAKTEQTEMEQDKAAKLKAERISAELDAAKKQGELIMRADVEAIWSDAWTKVRMTIDGFSALNEADKCLLISDLLALKIDNPRARGDAS